MRGEVSSRHQLETGYLIQDHLSIRGHHNFNPIKKLRLRKGWTYRQKSGPHQAGTLLSWSHGSHPPGPVACQCPLRAWPYPERTSGTAHLGHDCTQSVGLALPTWVMTAPRVLPKDLSARSPGLATTHLSRSQPQIPGLPLLTPDHAKS